MNTLDLDGLRQIMIESAGVDETVDLTGDISDSTFGDLGYDSLALLEASGRIERRFGIRLADDALTQDRSPRELIALVNRELLDAVATSTA